MLVLTFQIGDDRFALDIRHVREVVPRVRLQHVAGAPDWLAGLFIYRGRAVPVIDLHLLLGAGECPPHLSSRIVLTPLPDGGALVGLLAAQVADIRDVRPKGPALPALTAEGRPDLGQAFVEGNAILHMLEPGRLLPEPVRRLLAGLPGTEAPA